MDLSYSHSIVEGGFELISYTTLLIPLTLFIILQETVVRNCLLNPKKSAVMRLALEIPQFLTQILASRGAMGACYSTVFV